MLVASFILTERAVMLLRATLLLLATTALAQDQVNTGDIPHHPPTEGGQTMDEILEEMIQTDPGLAGVMELIGSKGMNPGALETEVEESRPSQHGKRATKVLVQVQTGAENQNQTEVQQLDLAANSAGSMSFKDLYFRQQTLIQKLTTRVQRLEYAQQKPTNQHDESASNDETGLTDLLKTLQAMVGDQEKQILQLQTNANKGDKIIENLKKGQDNSEFGDMLKIINHKLKNQDVLISRVQKVVDERDFDVEKLKLKKDATEELLRKMKQKLNEQGRQLEDLKETAITQSHFTKEVTPMKVRLALVEQHDADREANNVKLHHDVTTLKKKMEADAKNTSSTIQQQMKLIKTDMKVDFDRFATTLVVNLELRMGNNSNATSHLERQAVVLKSQTDAKFKEVLTTLKKITSAQVGFAVQGFTDESASGVDKNTTLKLNRVTYNQGDGYDVISGHFKAKVSGLYYFSATIVGRMTGELVDLRVSLVVDGEQMAGANTHPDTDGEWEATTVQTVTHLTAGQHVWLLNDMDGTKFNRWSGSSFTGFLISPDL